MTKEIEKKSKDGGLSDTDKFKREMYTLMDDYLEVKQESKELGYNDDAFKFKDYIEFYINSNK